MARTHEYWKEYMTSSWMSKPEVVQKYGFTAGDAFEDHFSLVSLENIIFEIIAFLALALDVLFDTSKKENEDEMAKQKPHTKEWYRQKALGFRYGLPVIGGTDEFDLTGLTDAQVNSATVINQAACVKLISANGYGILRIKVAKAAGSGELQAVPEAQFEALKHYILRYVVDAGTQVKITTSNADDLMLKLDIYYDPLVLSNTGARNDGEGETPVIDAIKAFLRSVEFNGQLILSDLVRSLRDVEGVKIAAVKEAASKYGTYSYDTQNTPNVGPIDEVRIADSGYMKLDESTLVINYKRLAE